MAEARYYATGKRKTAVARAWLTPGNGEITVNGKSFDEYFDVETARIVAEQPFVLTGTLGKFNVQATLKGGGKNAQSEALRHAVARALLAVNDDYRGTLKKAGLLTRDARVKERKKYGLAGARKRYQYSKR
ncbi:30S ribosomal protein S9 [Dissulfurirhabdus thermomarina]|uniref:Small ribosomal subunit protein uS9 n=1 Tax=Dissulfurirhabdus thermomarina TaxID=1765737 RepID=A0A6N9TL62_DISTH|nr:30S ribosomal protein S9 [Dissulfurirhabdus thermomarina]NDY42012.1 30S ribosomal protein S9 [Dissulfurirhabdus thermomarina]NMX24003.1 30S ribosomal protein S9 [Dissulfurirhabdus thermomarina]